MKSFTGRFVVVVGALALLLGVSGNLQVALARLTGTNPVGTYADAFCVGKASYEVCAAWDGNFVPTTDNTQYLGTSALQWKNTLTADLTVSDDASVTGDLFKVMGSTQSVAEAGTIEVAGVCGGILRIDDSGNITTNTTSTFTSPTSANAGCIVYVVNTGPGQINLATSSLFAGPVMGISMPHIPLGTNDAIIVGQMGGKWVALSSIVINF